MAYEKMEQESVDAIDDFAHLLTQYPDDPLIQYHYNRLQQKQIGSIITLESK
ncbi:MAG: hypothetical protein Q9M50_12335 [Methylococcales bacterium]|nr:hypothetical protein [Methylococcales bacterium]